MGVCGPCDRVAEAARPHLTQEMFVMPSSDDIVTPAPVALVAVQVLEWTVRTDRFVLEPRLSRDPGA